MAIAAGKPGIPAMVELEVLLFPKITHTISDYTVTLHNFQVMTDAA